MFLDKVVSVTVTNEPLQINSFLVNSITNTCETSYPTFVKFSIEIEDEEWKFLKKALSI